MPGGPVELALPMQGGVVVDGYAKGGISLLSDFTRYRHSVPMIDIGNCELLSVATGADETLTVFCYDGGGEYIGSVTCLDSLPAGAAYVKLMVAKSTDYETIEPLRVTLSGQPVLVKNDVPERLAAHFISFETSAPAAPGSDVGTEQSARCYDNGFVRLPPNYSRDGEAVPLVVFVHGTGGYNFYKGPTSNGGAGDYQALQEFIVNNGYALCDCSGLTNVNRNCGNAFAAPSFMTCITDMVNYLIANYNIKDDGIYVYGKSSGGFLCHMLALEQPVKVRAVGSLAPALSPMVSIAHHARTYTSTANIEAQQLGIDHTFTSGQFGEGDQAAIIDNVALWRQIDPFFAGTDLTDEQVAQILRMCYDAGGNSYHLNISDIPEAVSLCDSAQRHVSCPTRIWIAEDDYIVFHGNSKLFVEMAQRAGSPCYLRSLPAGTGMHHAVDTDDKALRTMYVTRYAGEVEVPVAYAELVDWFNRW